MQNQSQRSSKYNYPQFQKKFIVQLLFLILLCLATIYTVQYFFIEFFFQQGVQKGIPADHLYYELLSDQKTTMNYFFLGLVVTISSIIVFWGVNISHRIVGPLKRIQNFLKDPTNSNASTREPLTIRKNDYFQEITEDLNEFINKSNS